MNGYNNIKLIQYHSLRSHTTLLRSKFNRVLHICNTSVFVDLFCSFPYLFRRLSCLWPCNRWNDQFNPSGFFVIIIFKLVIFHTLSKMDYFNVYFSSRSQVLFSSYAWHWNCRHQIDPYVREREYRRERRLPIKTGAKPNLISTEPCSSLTC